MTPRRVLILGKSDVPVCNLSSYLVGQGVEVHLAAALQEQPPPDGVTLHPLRGTGARDLLRTRSQVRRLVATHRPQLVHAFYLTSYGYLAAGIREVPVLATGMGTDVFGAPELNRLLAPVRRWLTGRALRRADRVHSVADHMTRALIEFGVDPSRIETFPRGVDLDRFAVPAEPAPADAPMQLICTRRLEPVYDHATILAAIQSLDGLQLSIVGRGSLEPELRARVAAFGETSRVTFRGHVEHERMPALLGQAQLYVTAAHSDGTSSSLLEAMAAGCVPLATDIPANRAWVNDDVNGFLFAAGDAGSLGDALRRALTARSRFSQMAADNRTLVRQRASLEAGHRRVVRIYRELLGLPGTPA